MKNTSCYLKALAARHHSFGIEVAATQNQDNNASEASSLYVDASTKSVFLCT
uniref:Uncharacterized protein n=1 Tax=Setaria italica TaxID=4555 RepID=K3Z2B0_SETIT